jgi:tRNA threonylcarbamoyladenosine biosynthesis protein TsaE
MNDLDALLPAETASADATIALGRQLAETLRAGDVLALEGEVGAGKTHLVKGIAAGLGVDPESVTSPTFGLIQLYEGETVPLVHIDLYRLERPLDLAGIGFDEALDERAVCLVEWPELAADRMPSETIRLRLTHLGGNRRRVERVGALG